MFKVQMLLSRSLWLIFILSRVRFELAADQSDWANTMFRWFCYPKQLKSLRLSNNRFWFLIKSCRRGNLTGRNPKCSFIIFSSCLQKFCVWDSRAYRGRTAWWRSRRLLTLCHIAVSAWCRLCLNVRSWRRMGSSQPWFSSQRNNRPTCCKCIRFGEWFCL